MRFFLSLPNDYLTNFMEVGRLLNSSPQLFNPISYCVPWDILAIDLKVGISMIVANGI